MASTLMAELSDADLGIGGKELSDDDLGLAPAKPLSPLQNALKPITSYPETYATMNQEARNQMSHGLEQLGTPTGGDLTGSAVATAKGLGNLASGAAGYVVSPISAALRTVAGKPIEENTGIPKEYTEFAAGLALPGYGMSKLPGAAAKAERAGAHYDQIAAAAKRDYKAAHELGVELEPSFVHNSVNNIKKGLLDEHFTADSVSAPHTMSVLSHGAARHAPPPADPMAALTGTKTAKQAAATIEDIDGLRQQLGAVKVSSEATRSDRAAASIAQHRLDELMSDVPKSAVLKGDAKALNELMTSARGNHAAMRRMDVLAGREELADLNTGSAHAGGNEENATRQAYKTLIRPNIKGEIPAKKLGFSPREIAEIRKIANGDKPRDAFRGAGKLGPDAGLKGLAHLDAAIKSGGASLPFTGLTYGSKKIGEKLTRRQVDKLSDLVSSRAPVSGELAAEAPAQARSGLFLPALSASEPDRKHGGAVNNQKLLGYLARNKR